MAPCSTEDFLILVSYFVVPFPVLSGPSTKMVVIAGSTPNDVLEIGRLRSASSRRTEPRTNTSGSSVCFARPEHGVSRESSPPSHEFPVFCDQGGDLVSDGVDGIDIAYSAVIELDRKFCELSAAVVHEDEQFDASTLEWSCVLGANVRQAGEFSNFNDTVSE